MKKNQNLLKVLPYLNYENRKHITWWLKFVEHGKDNDGDFSSFDYNVEVLEIPYIALLDWDKVEEAYRKYCKEYSAPLSKRTFHKLEQLFSELGRVPERK